MYGCVCVDVPFIVYWFPQCACVRACVRACVCVCVFLDIVSVLFYIHLAEEERDTCNCFTLILSLMSCGCMLVFCVSSSRCREMVRDCVILIYKNDS